MKFAFLPRMPRYLPVIFIAAGFATIASIAHASMTCMRIDKFPVVPDSPILEKLEMHVKALAGFKDYQIKDIDGRFFIVLADDGNCKETRFCYHQLLDTRNGVVKDVFAFRGTSRVWMSLSPISIWLEQLQDEYSAMAFATTENTFISVQLPRFRDTILVESPSPERTKWLQAVCDALTK